MPDIHGIPAFDDNYVWCLNARGEVLATVIDPGDEEPVLRYLDEQGLALAAILVTHKHGDHTGGIAALKAVFPEAVVYGPANEPIPLREQALGDGDRVRPPGLDTGFVVMDVPGHTEGHIAYLADGLLFCGDTLFAGGCGRVFSGTHEQLYHSLRRLACLPADTRVFCAHEYTQANLGFARWVEPDNAALLQRSREVDELRAAGQPTVPSLLSEELATNPFMRTAQKAVVDAASSWAGRALLTGEEVFTAVRAWKDRDYD
jgi:hydroxyacylglutathione hydrolase